MQLCGEPANLNVLSNTTQHQARCRKTLRDIGEGAHEVVDAFVRAQMPEKQQCRRGAPGDLRQWTVRNGNRIVEHFHIGSRTDPQYPPAPLFRQCDYYGGVREGAADQPAGEGARFLSIEVRKLCPVEMDDIRPASQA